MLGGRMLVSRSAADLRIADEVLRVPDKPNYAFLMAGGRGSRLRPLTDECPKPMLSVGGKPILETILEGLSRQGFRRVFISVNYHRDLIKNHFRDGAEWKVEIEYIEEAEDRPLGTAGSLTLLPGLLKHPLLVMNADILTKASFDSLLDFHSRHRSFGTMCVRDQMLQVPYGVITVEQHQITGIVEKPEHRFLVNAGIYVLEPEALALVPRATRYDMPELFQKMQRQGFSIGAFHVSDYWRDIGGVDDLSNAHAEYFREFAQTDQLKRASAPRGRLKSRMR